MLKFTMWLGMAINIPVSSVPLPLQSSVQPGEAAALARQVGLSPVVLAVSGVTSEQVSAVFARIDQAGTLQLQLEALRSQMSLMTLRVGQLRNQLRADPANTQVVSQLRQAQAQLRTAKEAIAGVRSSIASSAASQLNSAVVQRLAASRSVRGMPVPAELKCIDRTPQSWRQLQADLVVERRALRASRPVPTEVASRLAVVRAQADVVAARQALTTQLPAIRALFGPS